MGHVRYVGYEGLKRTPQHAGPPWGGDGLAAPIDDCRFNVCYPLGALITDKSVPALHPRPDEVCIDDWCLKCYPERSLYHEDAHEAGNKWTRVQPIRGIHHVISWEQLSLLGSTSTSLGVYPLRSAIMRPEWRRVVKGDRHAGKIDLKGVSVL